MRTSGHVTAMIVLEINFTWLNQPMVKNYSNFEKNNVF